MATPSLLPNFLSCGESYGQDGMALWAAFGPKRRRLSTPELKHGALVCFSFTIQNLQYVFMGMV